MRNLTIAGKDSTWALDIMVQKQFYILQQIQQQQLIKENPKLPSFSLGDSATLFKIGRSLIFEVSFLFTSWNLLLSGFIFSFLWTMVKHGDDVLQIGWQEAMKLDIVNILMRSHFEIPGDLLQLFHINVKPHIKWEKRRWNARGQCLPFQATSREDNRLRASLPYCIMDVSEQSLLTDTVSKVFFLICMNPAQFLFLSQVCAVLLFEIKKQFQPGDSEDHKSYFDMPLIVGK